MNFVIDINKSGAKSKPFTNDFKELKEEIDVSYDEEIGDGAPPNIHERLTGAIIPYIDYDSFDSADMRIPSAKKIVKAIKSVFGANVNILLADRSGHSVKHNKYKLSLRAYIRNVGYFSCPQSASKFMMDSFKPLLGDCVDDVYKSNQNMGLLFNCKMGDPRILEPLDAKFERITYRYIETQTNAGFLLKSLIQNVDGETICLDPPNFTVRNQTIESVVSDVGIDGIVSACIKLMPNLSIRKVINKGDSQIIEFAKCSDKCAICKRVHVGNRQYVVYFPEHNIALFKCHDDEAKDKKIKLTLPDIVVSADEIKSMIPMEYVDDDEDDFDISRDEAEAKAEEEDFAEAEDDAEEIKLFNTPLGLPMDEDFSEYFISRYPNQFIMVDDHLYQFKDGAHTWVKLQNSDAIFQMLGDTIYRRLRNCLNRVFNGLEDAVKHAQGTKKLLILRSWGGRHGIVKSIEAAVRVDKSPFDNKPHLFGFKNGIYDLKQMEFRAGTSEDMVSQIADYNYEPRNETKRNKLMAIINQIMPMPDERDFLLRGMSSGLFGRTLQNMFILTGEGGNGKDMLISKLYRDCVGRDHYEYSNTTILTEKRKSDLCQGIANMHKKRVVVWSEPPKNSVLQGAVIKEITGVDQVNARGLYSTNTTTKIELTAFLLCNDIPRVDSVDGGLARRLFVVPFRSLFKDADEIETMANKSNVYLKNGDYESTEFREENQLTLFHILLEHFPKFQADKYMMTGVPKSIKDLSCKYLQDSDEFMSWFNEFYEKTDEAQAYIRTVDVYTQYKLSDLYNNLNRGEKRATNKKTMIDIICKNSKLRTSWSDRYQPTINGIKKSIDSVLVGYRIRPDEVDETEENNEDA